MEQLFDVCVELCVVCEDEKTQWHSAASHGQRESHAVNYLSHRRTQHSTLDRDDVFR